MRRTIHRPDFRIVTPDDLTACLKTSRRSLGYSQHDLAEMLDVQQPRVARIEARPGSVKVDRMLDILELLHMAVLAVPYADTIDRVQDFYRRRNR